MWPASREVSSAAQVLFSGVHIVRSRSSVFLILLLFLREAQRPSPDMLTLPGHVSPVF